MSEDTQLKTKNNTVRNVLLVISLMITASLFTLAAYYNIMDEATQAIADICFFETCNGFTHPNTCFTVQMRNVTTQIFRDSDCNILKNKCEYVNTDPSQILLRDATFGEGSCTWFAETKTCTCTIKATDVSKDTSSNIGGN